MLIGNYGVNRSTDGGNGFNPLQTKVVISTKPKRTMKLSTIGLDESQTIPSAVLAWGNRLIESTTSGRTWQSIPLPLPRRSLDDVSFVNPTTGYVLQHGSRLFSTRNRGRTWSEINSLGFNNLEDVSFSSAQDGYVDIGGNINTNFDLTDVLHTTNGGRSWQPQIITGHGGNIRAAPAAPGIAYFIASGLTFNAPSSEGFFSTTNGGASPQNTSLSISIGPEKLSAKRLRRQGNKINVKGTLSPVTSVGEMVQIAHKTVGGSWASADLRVASNGAFSTTIFGVKHTTDVVADVLGDGVNSGAGTPAARLTVTRS